MIISLSVANLSVAIQLKPLCIHNVNLREITSFKNQESLPLPQYLYVLYLIYLEEL